MYDPQRCCPAFSIFHLKFVIMAIGLGLGTAISGIAGLFGNLFQSGSANRWNEKQLQYQLQENQRNRAFSSREAATARRFNAHEAYLNRQFAQEMWHKNNLYNSLPNQVSQMRSAGINPALAYSGNSFAPASVPAGSAASGPAASSSGSISPTQYATTDVAGPALASARAIAEINNIDADTRQKNAQGSILESDAKFRDAINQGLLDLNGVQVSLGDSQISVNDSNAAVLRKQAARLDQDIQAFDKQMQLLDVQIKSGQLDNIGKKIDNYFKTPQYEALIDKIQSDTGKNKAEIHSVLSKLPFEIQKLKSSAQKDYADANLANSQSFTQYASEAMLSSLASLYDANAKIAITDGKIADIQFQNIRDVRGVRDAIPGFSHVLWAGKDLLSGILSTSVSPR